MAVLDGAIANVALPTIATDLHATPASSIWVVNAYQIAIVISLLSFSFLGDMFGYRRIYKCGLVVFLLSSLFCALSDSLQIESENSGIRSKSTGSSGTGRESWRRIKKIPTTNITTSSALINVSDCP